MKKSEAERLAHIQMHVYGTPKKKRKLNTLAHTHTQAVVSCETVRFWIPTGRILKTCLPFTEYSWIDKLAHKAVKLRKRFYLYSYLQINQMFWFMGLITRIGICKFQLSPFHPHTHTHIHTYRQKLSPSLSLFLFGFNNHWVTPITITSQPQIACLLLRAQ